MNPAPPIAMISEPTRSFVPGTTPRTVVVAVAIASPPSRSCHTRAVVDNASGTVHRHVIRQLGVVRRGLRPTLTFLPEPGAFILRLVGRLALGGGWRRLPGWLGRLAEIGVVSSDSEELRLRKTVLTLSSTMMATLACVWVATYAVLGLWVSAAIPFGYQLASALSIYTFARTRRYLLFRRSQLWMSLALPFALQWSLGGFQTSSAVCLWAFTAPVGALLFVGSRPAVPWFVAFGALVVVSGAIDPTLAAGAPDIPNAVVVTFFVLNVIGVTTVAYV